MIEVWDEIAALQRRLEGTVREFRPAGTALVPEKDRSPP
jgi:hypothetical protein